MITFYNPPVKRSIQGIAILLSLLIHTLAFAQTYNWKSVQIKGGGFVSGFIYSKADPNLLFARTDVGGAYRWNASNKTWTPLTDGILSANDWGVWSLAADPTDANKVYMATGLYSASWGQNGSIYKSTDKGITWKNISNLSIKLGGNDPGRGCGERLMIDPNNPSVLFLASKKDGLYRSTDSGVNWTKITSLPASYITFVDFDKSTGTTGNNTQTIYAGVADNIYNGGNVGVYRSTDGGASWTKLTNHPTQLTPKTFAPGNAALTPVPMDMYITSGNIIYFTFCNTVTPDGENSLPDPHKIISNGAVYKFNKSNNAWTDITPSGSNGLQGGFSSITASATNPNKIAIATIGRWWPNDELYFSADAGTNWASTFNSYNYASTWGASLNKGTLSTSKAPYAAQATIGWPSSIEMSPTNDNQVMIGYGGGVFVCYDTSPLFTNATSTNTASTTWVYENDGLEETVPLEIVSPTSGAPLVSAIGDIDGFVHSDVDVSPVQGKHGIEGTHTGTTRSIAFAENSPTKMVRAFDNDTYNKGAYSTDGGMTWTKFATKPAGVNSGDAGGKICINTDGSIILWASANAPLAYSTNNGSSWTASTGGVPNGLKPVADRVNKNKFYVFDPQNQKAYYSTNGGVSFSSATLTGTSSIPNYDEYQPELCATIANENHLWLANQINGLFRSTNGGLAWTKITAVTSAIKVTVGKSVTATGYPSVFIWGVVSGVNGVFRSDDQGTTWERLNDATTEWAHNPTTMSGDPRIYGRLYIGVGGRGIIYGDKSTATCTATITSPATSICPTGSVLLTASTGTSYKWSNAAGVISGATSATYSVTTADSYTVTVTDASGCTATSAATVITGTTQAVPTITSTTTSICPTGSVLLTSSTGTSYKWSNAAGVIAGATSATYSATTADSYTVEVTNASGCKNTSVAKVITGTTQAVPTIASTTTSICPTGSVLLTSSTGTSYKWSNSAGVIAGATNATYSATTADSYTVEVTNASGCKNTSVAKVITGTTQPVPTITSTTTSICPTGSILLTSSNGTSYKWSNAAGVIAGATSATYSATTADSYTVEVTNASGCKNTSVAKVITGTTQAVPTITSTTTSICPTGSVLLTSSTGTSYKWSNAAGVISGATSATYSATTADSYTVEVTNVSGCKNTSAATVITGTTQAVPTITSTTTSICPTGAVLLTSSTGTSYKWSSATGVISGATSSTYSTTTADSYTVEVTNASGCKNTSTATVITGTTQAVPTITSTTTSICPTGSVLLTSSTGTSYKWSNAAGVIAGATSATYSATTADSYTVEVTNASGCKNTSTATVITGTTQAVPTITSSTTSICPTGSVLLTSSTGTSYKWSNAAGVIAGATSATYSATTADSYTVEVTNASGCKNTSIAKVITGTTQATPTISSPTTSLCSTGSVLLTSSNGASYKWSNAAGIISGATSSTYSATTADSYTVEVTNASGCKNTSVATVTTGTTQTTPAITSPATSFCAGGSILLSANTGSGLTYQWSNASGNIATATNSTYLATAAGTYKVAVTTTACSSTLTSNTITITVNTAATAAITSPTTSFCAGGSVLLSANTGSGLTYQWSNASGNISGATSATYSATAAGAYKVSVTATGCSAAATSNVITITVTTGILWYQDADGDGKGDPAVTQTSCTQPAGYVSVGGDNCPADANKLTPGSCGCGQLETDTDGDTTPDCIDTDDDNDGISDANDCAPLDASIGGATVWYQDTDGDGKGDPSSSLNACTQPAGYVAAAGDACPADPAKIAAGTCGCGVPEGSCNVDCAGVLNGTAVLDNCNICTGGNTGKTPCISTATINGASANITVTPQPFQTTTTIKVENYGLIKSFTIISAAGALVDQRQGLNTTEITVGEDLSAGMYSVIIQSENGVYTTKIVKF